LGFNFAIKSCITSLMVRKKVKIVADQVEQNAEDIGNDGHFVVDQGRSFDAEKKSNFNFDS
jgi:hypothetical protein